MKCPKCQTELGRDVIRAKAEQPAMLHYELSLDSADDLQYDAVPPMFEDYDNNITFYCNECDEVLELDEDEVVEILKAEIEKEEKDENI